MRDTKGKKREKKREETRVFRISDAGLATLITREKCGTDGATVNQEVEESVGGNGYRSRSLFRKMENDI